MEDNYNKIKILIAALYCCLSPANEIRTCRAPGEFCDFCKAQKECSENSHGDIPYSGKRKYENIYFNKVGEEQIKENISFIKKEYDLFSFMDNGKFESLVNMLITKYSNNFVQEEMEL